VNKGKHLNMYLVKGTQAGDYLTQFFTSFKAVK
jgi:hypothetical protein